MTKRLFILSQILVFALLSTWAQGPNNSEDYYQAANGKKGQDLKTALFNIIKLSSPAPISYDGLIESYKETDTRSDGKVRDWYSNATNYTHGIDNEGNYKKEGDVYNREHLIPQSWFNKAAPMKSDIVHVVPTDGYVNNRRSDLPLAEVGSATYTSINGYSKLGPCKTTGYSGKVFEPNDEVKGDIARIYFYMATCYQDKITGWSGEVITGTPYQPYADWYFDMLMRWSKLDPIDEVEIARNNAVKKEQGNRNPFVDYPGLEEYIWGDKKNETFYYDNYNGNENYVASPTFSPATGTTFTESLAITLACSTTGATIRYTTDGSTPNQQSALYSAPISISETTTIKAIAYNDGNASSVASATYTKSSGETPSGEVFTKVTSKSQLVAGNKYILVYEDGPCSLGGISSTSTKYGLPTDITLDKTNNTATITDDVKVLTLGGSSGAWTFSFDNSYLSWNSGNSLQTSSSAYNWNISVSANSAVVKTTNSERELQFNASSPRFACYSSGQKTVYLYVLAAASEKQHVTLSFSASSATAILGEAFSAPVLTVNPSAASSEVAYTSSNESVATVDASTGEVTIISEGTTTITAAISGSETYEDASATYELTVEQMGQTTEYSATFNFTENSYGMTPLSGSTSEYNPNPTTITSGDITLTMAGQNSSRYWKTADSYELRIYKACTMNISAPEKGTITKIVFAGANANDILFAGNSLNNKTWTGNEQSVRFTFGSSQKINTIDVTYEMESTVPEPEAETVSISSAGYATLYYGDKNLEVPAGVKAYTYSVVGGELIVNNTYEADDIIPAGTGVVLEASAGDYSFTVSEEGGLSDDGNMLRGSDEAEEVSDANYTYYILSDGTKGIGFYYGKKDGKDSPHAISNAAHKAYLAVPNEQTGAKTGFAFSMLADAISTAVISEQPAPVYNLQGQRVNNAQLKPGIYVSNGRKFIVR